MKTWLLIVAVAGGFLLLAGCSESRLTIEGYQVLTAHNLTDVKGCDRISTITIAASLWTKMNTGTLTFGTQNWERTENDINRSARNQAAKTGGNRILATSIIEGMQQDFDVYKCPKEGKGTRPEAKQ